jgi:predicted nucleic acid-binding protein
VVKRTSLNLELDLVDRARAVLGTKGTTDTIHRALEEVVRRESLKRLAEWTFEHVTPVEFEDAEVSDQFVSMLEDGEIATCDIVRFELLWSTQHTESFTSLRRDLDMLRDVPIGKRVWRRALDVFELFAAEGPLHHRQVKIPDLLVAAAAEIAELPVLHYDRDFEAIAAVTGQPVRALASLGSL